MLGRPKYQKPHKTSRLRWLSTFSDTHWVLHVLLCRRQCRIAQKKASWLESKMLSRSFPHPIIGKNPWWKKFAASHCGAILSQMPVGIIRRNKFIGQWLSWGVSRWVNRSLVSGWVGIWLETLGGRCCPCPSYLQGTPQSPILILITQWHPDSDVWGSYPQS